jgi:hypothetical protein
MILLISKNENDSHREKQEISMKIIEIGTVMNVIDEHPEKQEISMKIIDV